MLQKKGRHACTKKEIEEQKSTRESVINTNNIAQEPTIPQRLSYYWDTLSTTYNMLAGGNEEMRRYHRVINASNTDITSGNYKLQNR
jgi:hypothetical protein